MKSGPRFEKYVLFGKISRKGKKGSHLEKWVTLGKRVTPEKVGHTCKNG